MNKLPLTGENLEEIINDMMNDEIEYLISLREVFFKRYAIFKVEDEEYPIAVQRGFEEFVDGLELVGDVLDDIGIIPKPD